ncbi:MAG: lamin tail domain-containing protein, partial [Patescibacteria group bacterium]
EWIELLNVGPEAIDLRGWTLANRSGKKFSFHGNAIGVGEYLLIRKPELALSLRNSGETLSFYNAAGELVDKSEYKGVAQEGKSVSRTPAGKFLFSEPTPGAANTFPQVALAVENIPLGMPLRDATLNAFEIILLALGVGALCAVAVLFVLKRNEEIHKLLFGGDKTVR